MATKVGAISFGSNILENSNDNLDPRTSHKITSDKNTISNISSKNNTENRKGTTGKIKKGNDKIINNLNISNLNICFKNYLEFDFDIKNNNLRIFILIFICIYFFKISTIFFIKFLTFF